MTPLEKCLNEIVSRHHFNYILPEILESLTKKFFRIKEGGSKDKLSWNEEAEKYVLHEVLKEGII